MEDVVYKPCKNCKTLDYDNADQENFNHTEDGKLIVEPDRCDQCDFSLALSDSDQLH